jgi:lipopolysaccharide assembly protein A
MRWIHMTIIGLFVAVTLIFLVQNREIVSVDFLGFSLRTPLALMAAIFYLLGAMTGSSAFALLRRSWQGVGRNAIPPR